MNKTLFIKHLPILKKQKEEEIARLAAIGVRPDETYMNFLYRIRQEQLAKETAK